MTQVSLRNVTKRFGTFTAVDGVSVDIPDGSFVCLLGPSGCGKTTLLRMIAGLEDLSEGELMVGGQSYGEVPAHERNFGMVFQSLALFPHLSVADNISYPLRIRGISKGECRAKAKELLELVQLSGIEDRRIHQLSGGQRQRVAIARGLAIDPQVFLLDEPLSALDANLREHMQIELRNLQRKLGVTTIVVTHDQREAMSMADVVIVMRDGKLQQIGTPMEIYRNPANAFVAGFIGVSNLLKGILDGRRFSLSGAQLDLTPEDIIPDGVAGPAVLSVRPEDITLFAGADGAGPHGRVTFIRDLGASVEILVDLGGAEVTSICSPKSRPDVDIGDEVTLEIHPGRSKVLAA
ncbi:ABC transporter ATP-binding protein [Litorisediminicola beolgyonensis]|uniref:ABC transporter ATP-binding protein n=1 Tax=Litorisediminicola beolgyonensis TaxID=1173614 RepID=A0ABW3ZIR0_9RHOB